jgi:anti-sigma regulatory factor (Ser/Thr protein kinase)
VADRVALPAHPRSVREARRFVGDRVAALGLDRLRRDAELLTSELVTNAIVHAGTAVTVEVSGEGGRIRVAVSDGRPPPVHRSAFHDPEAPDGRGLLLLEIVADSWGVDSAEQGKTVWFDLSATGDAL